MHVAKRTRGVDAFTSDATPVHLITREAFELYSRKLAPGGVVLLQISNRHLELAPIMARTAGALGLIVRDAYDSDARVQGEGDWKIRPSGCS